jgi:hypothetical protein
LFRRAPKCAEVHSPGPHRNHWESMEHVDRIHQSVQWHFMDSSVRWRVLRNPCPPAAPIAVRCASKFDPRSADTRQEPPTFGSVARLCPPPSSGALSPPQGGSSCMCPSPRVLTARSGFCSDRVGCCPDRHLGLTPIFGCPARWDRGQGVGSGALEGRQIGRS